MNPDKRGQSQSLVNRAHFCGCTRCVGVLNFCSRASTTLYLLFTHTAALNLLCPPLTISVDFVKWAPELIEDEGNGVIHQR
jgi:hypothetical protein